MQALRFAEARQALDDGLLVANENDERYQVAELYRLKGELHLAETNDFARAEECFQTAIEQRACNRVGRGNFVPQ